MLFLDTSLQEILYGDPIQQGGPASNLSSEHAGITVLACGHLNLTLQLQLRSHSFTDATSIGMYVQEQVD